jgi:phage regulator Rha-like protein
MNNLKYLEIKRLIKELEFVETNFEYQSEILKITELDFNKSIYTFLRKFPELESIYKERKEELDSILNTGTALEDIITETKEEIESIDSPQIKKLYRDIVKMTHPDIVNNFRLNEVYKEASEAYECSDIIKLYQISSELELNHELNDDIIQKINEKIKLLKIQTEMLNSTFTYRWIKSAQKDEVVLDYIKSKII